MSSAPRTRVAGAHVSFCITQPGLARDVAEIACAHCEGCARLPDLTLPDQLALDFAG